MYSTVLLLMSYSLIQVLRIKTWFVLEAKPPEAHYIPIKITKKYSAVNQEPCILVSLPSSTLPCMWNGASTLQLA